MGNEELLAIIKQVRNIFDTVSIECGMASRNSMDMLEEILLSGNQSMAISFAYHVQNRSQVMRNLLYSINKAAEGILKTSKSEPPVELASS